MSQECSSSLQIGSQERSNSLQSQAVKERTLKRLVQDEQPLNANNNNHLSVGNASNAERNADTQKNKKEKTAMTFQKSSAPTLVWRVKIPKSILDTGCLPIIDITPNPLMQDSPIPLSSKGTINLATSNSNSELLTTPLQLMILPGNLNYNKNYEAACLASNLMRWTPYLQQRSVSTNPSVQMPLVLSSETENNIVSLSQIDKLPSLPYPKVQLPPTSESRI